MSKKLFTGILAATVAASTVATSIIPMTNYSSNLVAKEKISEVSETINKNQVKRAITKPAQTIHINDNNVTFIAVISEVGLGEPTLYNQFWYLMDKVNFDSMYNENNQRLPGFIAEQVPVNCTVDAAYINSLPTRYPEYAEPLSCANPITAGSYVAFKFKDNYLESDLEIFDQFYPIFQLKDVDMQVPTINGTTNFVVNVNNMLSKEQIISHISAYDDTDGIVPVVEEPGGTYNPANKKTGEFTLNVSASDKAGNKNIVTINVKVVDVDKPVISGTNSYSRSYDNPISIEEIKAGLSISDNYDSNLTLSVVSDTYSSNKSKVGNYSVTFKTTDTSNNVSNVFTVNISVKDQIKPIITAPGTINVGTNLALTMEQLKSKISINDGYDGVIQVTDNMISGFDKYLADTKKVGNYDLTITVSDKNGNTQTTTIKLVVEDKVAPTITFDNYFIVLEQGQSLTQEQIKEYAAKALGLNKETIVEVNGTYDTNSVGVYKMSVRTIDGQEHSINITISEKMPENLRQLKWYEAVYKWFTILFNIEEEYKTQSFWDFRTRCQSISKVYSTGQILDNKLIK